MNFTMISLVHIDQYSFPMARVYEDGHPVCVYTLLTLAQFFSRNLKKKNITKQQQQEEAVKSVFVLLLW